MSKTRSGLVLSSVCYLISASVGTWLSIQRHLPAEFGGLMHGDDVVKGFFTWKGTALSPPFPLSLAQLVLTGCVMKGGQSGRAGIRGLTVLGGSYTLGQLGEPIVWRLFKSHTFEPAPALLVVTNMLCSLAMMVFGIREWNSGREKSRWSDSNRRPLIYETSALPLSYTGLELTLRASRTRLRSVQSRI